LLGVILVHGIQKHAKNIEQGFAPRHINVNCLQEAEGAEQQEPNTPKTEAGIDNKATIEPECETKRIPLDPRVPNKTIMISQDLTSEEETELLSFLNKNSDVFTWNTSDLT
jgi:hypothetical protein